jgi:hypothetical protein
MVRLNPQELMPGVAGSARLVLLGSSISLRTTPGLPSFYCGSAAGVSDDSHLPFGGSDSFDPAGMSSYSLSSAYPVLNTVSETRYGRIVSFRNSLVSGQGGLQVSRYIPGVTGLGLMPGDVATKCTLRHASHMMPMWIGMGGDYCTIRTAYDREVVLAFGRPIPVMEMDLLFPCYVSDNVRCRPLSPLS